MLTPAIPVNERERLKALRDMKVLDTPPEERFDRVTRLARQVFATKIALVSLVDENRQWFKSRQGLDATETPRDISFCGHAILNDKIMVINDAVKDERFCDNPLVCGAPNIRFYAGYPLAAPDGSRVGTLCIIDDKPRDVTKEQLRVFRELGRMIEEELVAASEATTDAATGLSTRKGFLTIADHLLAMCKRCEQPATLIMFHLQNLGDIEASHGPDESEAAAAELTHLLVPSFRGSDIIARICVDVFCVLLSGTDLDGADPARMRLDQHLSARNRDEGVPYALEVNKQAIAFKEGRHGDAAGLLNDGEIRIMESLQEQETELAAAPT